MTHSRFKCERLRIDRDHVRFKRIFEMRQINTLETVLLMMGIPEEYRMHFGPVCSISFSEDSYNGSYDAYQTLTHQRFQLRIKIHAN